MTSSPMIWTIGHSSRTMELFLQMLRSFAIEILVDVRQFPGSRKFPYFSKENLATVLPQHNIEYIHMVELGGRRKPAKDSPNITWKNEAFRSYADYMETDAFANAVEKLEHIATSGRTAYMCSEAVWWSCHRSMISDHLKANGWVVMHIMDIDVAKEHPYTAPARIVNGRLTYRPDDSQLLFPT